MAAGLSVVVPLVCVLLIQLRRARREDRERRTRQQSLDTESGSNVLGDGPPTYEQLFGPGYEPNINTDLTRDRNGSMDTLIVDSENDGRDGGGGGRGGGGARTRFDSGDGGGGGGHANPALEIGSEDIDSGHGSGDGGDGSEGPRLSVISGHEVRDAILSGPHANSAPNYGSIVPPSSPTSSSSSHARPGAVVGVSTLDVNGLENSATRTPDANQWPPNDGNSNSNNPNDASSSPRSQSSSSPSSSSSSVPSNQNNEESPPLSPHSPSTPSSSLLASSSSPSSSTSRFSSQDNPSLSTPSYYPNPPPPPPPPSMLPQRTLPGMHISIHDFFTALKNQSEREAPPPSYEEALEILAKVEKAKKKAKK